MRGRTCFSCVNKIRNNRKVCYVFLILFLMLFLLVKHQYEENVKVKDNSFLWFQHNQNISKYLKIDEKTCIICRDFSISKNDQQELLMYITSEPSHALERYTVRETWGKLVRPSPLFITGISEDDNIMKKLYDEANVYGDIIVEDFVDTYLNLTLKTGFILKHFIQNELKSNYIMKTDDDVLINPKIILSLIENVSKKTNNDNLPIIGYEFSNAHPYRSPSNKWYIPNELYDEPIYPSYVSGIGYLVPGNKIPQLLNGSFKYKLFPYEDVFFTGIVRDKVNIDIYHEGRIKSMKPLLNYHCFYRHSPLVHHLDTNDLEVIWHAINTRSDINCHNWLIKLLNLYIF